MDERFGDVLTRLMRDRKQKELALNLARSLNKDVSQIYRWRRGEATPGLDTSDVDGIIEYLRLNATEMRVLRAAQVASLREGPKKRARAKESPCVARLIRRGQQPPLDTLSKSPIRSSKGSAGILEEITQLLKNLPPGSGQDDMANTITLTWQGRDDAFETDEELRLSWQEALQSVLNSGWRVRHLCRLNSDVERTVHLVELMLNFVGSGNYFPYYFKTYDTLDIPHDLLVVPGIAAAWLYSAHSPHRVDSGSITRDPQQIQNIAGYANQLFAQTTRLVRAYFYDKNDLEYSAALRDAENHPGGRSVVKDGLSIVTQPERWFTDDMSLRLSSDIPIAYWRTIFALRKERISQFKRYVKEYDYRDICTLRGLERFVRGGEFPRDDPLRKHKQDKSLRLDQLQNAVTLLQPPYRYKIALIGAPNDTEFSGMRFDSLWEVTGDKSVFMETWIPDRDGHPIGANLHITEPTVAAGFQGYFDKIWKRIPFEHRDTENVIALLNRYIEELQRDIAESGE